MSIKLFFAIVFLGNTLLFGQTGGLKGRITDRENKEELLFANVQVSRGGKIVANAITDLSGEFTVVGLAPGVYELKAAYVGYEIHSSEEVLVLTNKITNKSIEMEPAAIIMCPVVISEYMEPVICCLCRTICYFSCEVEGCCLFSQIDESIFADSSEVEESLPLDKAVVCTVYPNPFMDFATLEISSEVEIVDLRIKLFDATGSQVRNMGVNSRSMRIERQGLAAGPYVYVLSAQDQLLATGRLVVQR